MRTRSTGIIAQNRSIIRVAIVTASILLVPLVATRFTGGPGWSPGDFVLAGGLLFGIGLAFELITRRATSIVYRSAIGLALATALFLLWANLAVGLIGSEDEPANLMYNGVLAVGFIGAILARLRPGGMAQAMFATAFAQALVAAIALVAGMEQYPGSSVPEILNVNGFFVVLWIGSALLFRWAGEGSTRDRRPE